MMRLVREIVIHCSGTPNGQAVSAMDIDGWHRRNGWRRQNAHRLGFNPGLTSIGYHFLVLTNAELATGRGLSEVGAHCYGHNLTSVGVCLIGNDKWTRAQWSTLAMVVGELKRKFPSAHVLGHRDLSRDIDGDGIVERHEWVKTCPNFDAGAWYRGGMQPVRGHILE